MPALQAKGYTVLNADAETGKCRRHHLHFSPGKDLAPLHQKLADAGVIASLRVDRKGQNYLRLSPHYYNTDAELQRMVELL